MLELAYYVLPIMFESNGHAFDTLIATISTKFSEDRLKNCLKVAFFFLHLLPYDFPGRRQFVWPFRAYYACLLIAEISRYALKLFQAIAMLGFYIVNFAIGITFIGAVISVILTGVLGVRLEMNQPRRPGTGMNISSQLDTD